MLAMDWTDKSKRLRKLVVAKPKALLGTPLRLGNCKWP